MRPRWPGSHWLSARQLPGAELLTEKLAGLGRGPLPLAGGMGSNTGRGRAHGGTGGETAPRLEAGTGGIASAGSRLHCAQLGMPGSSACSRCPPGGSPCTPGGGSRCTPGGLPYTPGGSPCTPGSSRCTPGGSPCTPASPAHGPLTPSQAAALGPLLGLPLTAFPISRPEKDSGLDFRGCRFSGYPKILEAPGRRAGTQQISHRPPLGRRERYTSRSRSASVRAPHRKRCAGKGAVRPEARRPGQSFRLISWSDC